MIEELLKAIDDSGDRAGPQELAEILWLAARIAPDPQLDNEQDESSNAQEPSQSEDDGAETGASDEGEPSTQLFTGVGDEGGKGDRRGTKVTVARAGALDDPLAVMRSLRHLGRGAVVAGDELDEERTVARSVEQLMLSPVLRRTRGRWLDLALVVDANCSMLLWTDLVAELHKVLRQSGVFRDTRLWHLRDTAPDTEDPSAPGGSAVALSRTPDGATRAPQEISDPSGRRLILVVTDTVGSGWSAAPLGKVLRHWSSHNPVAVLNVLPERLWSRGAARPAPVLLYNGAPGSPNTAWRLASATRRALPRRRVAHTLDSRRVAVPVIEASAHSLGALTQLVAGGSRWQRMACIRLNAPDDLSEASTDGDAAGTEALTADQALERFTASASPMARRLAGYLAAVPLTMPVMTLVRRSMLPDSNNGHLVEVVLGGLFEPWDAQSGAGDLAQLEFDFLPGIREALLGAQLRSEVTRVQEHVRSTVWDYLSQQPRSNGRFAATRVTSEAGRAGTAAQRNPGEAPSVGVPAESIPFAEAPRSERPRAREQSVDVPDVVPVFGRRLVQVNDPARSDRTICVGILLAPRLVLTTAHGVVGMSRVSVASSAGVVRCEADVALIEESVGVALLVTDQDILGPERVESPATPRLGSVPESLPTEALVLHAPWPSGAFAGTLGILARGDVGARGSLVFQGRAGAVLPPPDNSGMPVFCDGVLVGLVVSRRTAQDLSVVPIDPILRVSEFAELLAEHAVIRPAVQRAPLARRTHLCIAFDFTRLERLRGDAEQIVRSVVREAIGAPRVNKARGRPDVTVYSFAFEEGFHYSAKLGALLVGISTVLTQRFSIPAESGSFNVSMGVSAVSDESNNSAALVNAARMVNSEEVRSRSRRHGSLSSSRPGLILVVSEEVLDEIEQNVTETWRQQFLRVSDSDPDLGRLPDAHLCLRDPLELGVALVAANHDATAGEHLTLGFSQGARRDLRSDKPRAPLAFVSHAGSPGLSARRESPEPSRSFLDVYQSLAEHMSQLVPHPAGWDPVCAELGVPQSRTEVRDSLEAIGTCRVFVPLISRSYLANDWCGRMWDAFSRRRVMTRSSDDPALAQTCIIPVLWTPLGTVRLPSRVASIQRFFPDGASEQIHRYQKEGLLGLLRTNRDDYELVVWRLAREIERLLNEYSVEPRIFGSAEELENAFAEPGELQEPGEAVQ